MTAYADHPRAPQVLVACLLALLLGQAAALGAHSRDVSLARCGQDLPALDPALRLDAELSFGGELTLGRRTEVVAVLVNRGTTALDLRAAQAVVTSPAGGRPVATPPAGRPVERLLEPGQFVRQAVTLDLAPCGAALAPGFYEVAVVVRLVVDGEQVERLTTRQAAVVRR